MRMNKNKKVHSDNISPQFVAHAGQHYELSSFRAEIELEKKVFWQLGDKWSFDDAQWHSR